jgi:hypothetical protein
MKLQYLGDAKDSFKWDYHDYLLSELGYPLFNIALMMTPDDGGNDGKLSASTYPARPEIIAFCQKLRTERSIEAIKSLPQQSGASYEVDLHKGATLFSNRSRKNYFSGIQGAERQVFFLDPDNGFEPEKSINEKHVAFEDISSILGQLSERALVTVFQHHRRKRFSDDFESIRQRIPTGYSTAIHWHSLMFVAISRSASVIREVIEANRRYAAPKGDSLKVIV